MEMCKSHPQFLRCCLPALFPNEYHCTNHWILTFAGILNDYCLLLLLLVPVHPSFSQKNLLPESHSLFYNTTALALVL